MCQRLDMYISVILRDINGTSTEIENEPMKGSPRLLVQSLRAYRLSQTG